MIKSKNVLQDSESYGTLEKGDEVLSYYDQCRLHSMQRDLTADHIIKFICFLRVQEHSSKNGGKISAFALKELIKKYPKKEQNSIKKEIDRKMDRFHINQTLKKYPINSRTPTRKWSLMSFNLGRDPYPTAYEIFNTWNYYTLIQKWFGLHDLDKIVTRNKFPRDKTLYWKQEWFKHIHTCSRGKPTPPKVSRWWGSKARKDYPPRKPETIIKQFKTDLKHEFFNYEEIKDISIYPPIFPPKKDHETSRRFKIFFEGSRYNKELRTTGLNLHRTIKELIPYGLKYNCIYDPYSEKIISYNDKLPYPEGIKTYSQSQQGPSPTKNKIHRLYYNKTHYKGQEIKEMVQPPEIIIKCPNCKREGPEYEVKRYDTKRHESYCLFCGLVFEDMEKLSLTGKPTNDYQEDVDKPRIGEKNNKPEKLSQTVYAPMGKPNKIKRGNQAYYWAAKKENGGKLELNNKKAYYASLNLETQEGKQAREKGRQDSKYQDQKDTLEILTDYYTYYKGGPCEPQKIHLIKASERFIMLDGEIRDFQGIRSKINPPKGTRKDVRKNILFGLLIYELESSGYTFKPCNGEGKLPDFRKNGPGKTIGFNRQVYELILNKLALKMLE